MERLITLRDAREGKRLDESAIPIYRELLQAVLQAYMQVNGPEAYKRNLALLSTWQAAGRAGEVALLSLEAMEWDEHYGCTFGSMLQSKPIFSSQFSGKVIEIAFWHWPAILNKVLE